MSYYLPILRHVKQNLTSATSQSFEGGWHFLSGGIAGIQDLELVPDSDLDNFSSDFQHLGFKQDGTVSDEMIQLQPGVECDCFQHFIIPPNTWKENIMDRKVNPGEYQFWNWAPWRARIDSYNSVRDWIASCVEEVEGMVERGEVVPSTGDSDTSETEEEGEEGENIRKRREVADESGTETGNFEEDNLNDEDDWVKVDHQ